jgi:arginyl-tRNA synthetase
MPFFSQFINLMKEQLQSLINTALETLKTDGFISPDIAATIKIEHTKNKSHGDYATNIALMLAGSAKTNPKKIAQKIIDSLPSSTLVERCEIAGPGFINFFLEKKSKNQIVETINTLKQDFGRLNIGQGRRVLIEFVSANPTGPLHVGHGRGAAFGATLANLLMIAGFEVDKEYYVNDAGRQMDILAVSVWIRYIQFCQGKIDFPANGYKGEYVTALAKEIYDSHGESYFHDANVVCDGLPADEHQEGDKEVYIDALIAKARQLMGESGFNVFHQKALHFVLDDIKQDLSEFGVNFTTWYSEKSMFESGALEQGIKALSSRKLTYEKEGALWFKSTAFGDEKDRVLLRANGQSTYFASDVAYHWDKYERGYDKVIDIFGADHHGYVSRVAASLKALGKDSDVFDVLLVQFAILYRGNTRVQMSTRSGSFVTLRELRDEVGTDAARFFYVMRKREQHMDFDLELAKSQSNENPVYYIQYAHARICSVFRQLAERGWDFAIELGMQNSHLLDGAHEEQLMSLLNRYPEVIEAAANNYEPHLIAYYLRELANGLHTYYNAHQFLVDDVKLRNARLCLIMSVRQVLNNGLTLLGLSSPERM